VTNTCDDSVDVWNAAQGAQVGSIPAFGAQWIAINQNTKIAYVTGGSGELQAIDLRTGQTVATIANHGGMTGKAAVNPSSNTVYVMDSGEIDIVDGAANTLTGTISSLLEDPIALAADPAANKLYVAEQSCVQVFDSAGNLLQTIPLDIIPAGVSVDPASGMVYVAGYNPNQLGTADQSKLVTIDGATDSISNVQDFPGEMAHNGNIAVNPIDHQVTIASAFGGTYLFDESGRLIRTTNVSSDLDYDYTTGAAVNMDTGNTYEATESGGLKVYNKDGLQISVMPASCAAGVDVTTL
jgi:DNA-binding beta-propeller fold protein YncE